MGTCCGGEDRKVNNIIQASEKAETNKKLVKKEPQTYTCIKCGFATVNKKVLTKHFRIEHRNHGGRPDCYTCEICDFTGSEKVILNLCFEILFEHYDRVQ